MLSYADRPYRFKRAELYRFLVLAFPVIVSNGTDAVMMFIDRLFLSHYSASSGEMYLNAAMVGAVTTYTVMCLFILTTGGSNALIAQYLGAKQPQRCADVCSQSIYFSLASYPLLIIFSFLTPNLYGLFNHHPLQTELESQYTTILLWGSVISILRSGFGGFFVAVQNTKIVMIANVSGLLLNIPLNYVLIFGSAYTPALGIVGAGIATVLSGLFALMILIAVYVSNRTNRIYHTRRLPVYEWHLMKKLLYYSLPTGVDTLIGLVTFSFFLSAMNSYGEVVGAAVSIAINWDMMFFIPMIGAEIAGIAIIGQHMGAGNITEAKRATYLCIVVMCSYALINGAAMLLFTDSMVSLFLSNMGNAEAVRPLAISMLRLIPIYLLADAVHLALVACLRGAGDTRVIVAIFAAVNISFWVAVYFAAYRQYFTPMQSWYIFIGFVICISISVVLRYLQGKWKYMKVVDSYSP